MSSNLEHIDDIFGRKLYHAEVEPEEKNWDVIAGRLNRKKSKKKMMFFARWAAGVLILVSLGLNLYLVLSHRNTTEQLELSDSPNTLSETKAAKERAEISTKSKREIQPVSKLAKSSDSRSLPTEKREGKSNVEISEKIYRENTVFETAVAKDSSEVIHSDMETIHPIRLAFINTTDQHDIDMINISSAARDKETVEEPDFSKFEEIGAEKSENSWELAGNFAPVYSNRHITTNGYDYLVDRYNNAETGIVSYAGGLYVKLNTKHKLAFQTGVSYSRIGQVKEQVELYALNETYVERYDAVVISENTPTNLSVLNSTGTIATSESDAIKTNTDASPLSNSAQTDVFLGDDQTRQEVNYDMTQIFEYVEIPFIVHYQLLDRKFGMSVFGGLKTHFLLGTSNYLNRGNDKIELGETKDITSFNYSSSVGLGLNYQLFSRMQFTLEPTFNYYLNSVNKSPAIRVYPYTFGVYTGITYSL